MEKSWNKTIGLKYYSQKFLFAFQDVIMNSENLGNYIYGCTGNACGFSLSVLYAGSNFAAFTGNTADDDSDLQFVEMGFLYYENEIKPTNQFIF